MINVALHKPVIARGYGAVDMLENTSLTMINDGDANVTYGSDGHCVVLRNAHNIGMVEITIDLGDIYEIDSVEFWLDRSKTSSWGYGIYVGNSTTYTENRLCKNLYKIWTHAANLNRMHSYCPTPFMGNYIIIRVLKGDSICEFKAYSRKY